MRTAPRESRREKKIQKKHPEDGNFFDGGMSYASSSRQE